MKVVNVYTYGGVDKAKRAGVVYCGRPGPLGNPFEIEGEVTREKAIDFYRRWLYDRLVEGDEKVIAALEALKEDSLLGCFCSPKKCHCDIIIKAWYWYKENKDGLRNGN
jgi:hypothetical protein